MDISKIVVIAMILVVIIVMLKNIRPEYAVAVQIIGGVFIFLLVITHVMSILGVIENISHAIQFDSLYLKILLKVVGIAYIAEFGINICNDAGQSALASKVELAAKVLILIVALPVLNTLLNKMALILR